MSYPVHRYQRRFRGVMDAFLGAEQECPVVLPHDEAGRLVVMPTLTLDGQHLLYNPPTEYSQYARIVSGTGVALRFNPVSIRPGRGGCLVVIAAPSAAQALYAFTHPAGVPPNVVLNYTQDASVVPTPLGHSGARPTTTTFYTYDLDTFDNGVLALPSGTGLPIAVQGLFIPEGRELSLTRQGVGAQIIANFWWTDFPK